ncbi:MAG: hypothetical protein AAF791_05735 [Bacteroidota bacterium]
MPDGLSVIRRVVSGVPDDSPEAAVLTQSLAALDSLPRSAPDAEVVSRVLARAAEASDLDALAAVRGAVGLGPVQSSTEAVVLAQSLHALDALPPYHPDASRIEGAEAEAERATFAAVAVLESGAMPATPEAEILRQSVDALESLPAYAPSDAALAAVLARAHEASVHPVRVAYGDAEGPETAEVALLAQSRQALDALPSYAPTTEAVAAVLAAASAAVLASVPSGSRRAPDRAARPAERTKRRAGVWAGVATLAAGVLAVVLLLLPPASVSSGADLVADAETATAPLSPAPASPAPETEADEIVAEAPLVVAVPPPQVVQRRAPRGPSANGFVPVAERSPVVAAVPTPTEESADLASADAPVPPDWDAGDDLRLLSLRLRQLREQNAGIEWDEPSVAFGAADPSAAGATPGVQAVREGAPAGAVRVRTVPTDTTSRR